jgi:hypothetical protein
MIRHHCFMIGSVGPRPDSVPRMSREFRQTTAHSGIRRHKIDIGTTDVSARQGLVSPLQTGCPRQDSNLRTRLRRPLLYPLSYGGSGRRGNITSTPDLIA